MSASFYFVYYLSFIPHALQRGCDGCGLHRVITPPPGDTPPHSGKGYGLPNGMGFQAE